MRIEGPESTDRPIASSTHPLTPLLPCRDCRDLEAQMFAPRLEIRPDRFFAEFPARCEREAPHPFRAPDHAAGRYRANISIGVASNSWLLLKSAFEHGRLR